MTRRRIIAVLVACTVAFGVGAGVASASTSTYDTGVWPVGNLVSYCYDASSKAVTPAANGMQVDFKAFVYKKKRTTTCSTSNPGVNFYSGESEVQAILYRSGDMAICASTGRVQTPSTASSWGVGKTWNKSGICSTTTSFVVGAAGDWQIVLNKEFSGPAIGPFRI